MRVCCRCQEFSRCPHIQLRIQCPFRLSDYGLSPFQIAQATGPHRPENHSHPCILSRLPYHCDGYCAHCHQHKRGGGGCAICCMGCCRSHCTSLTFFSSNFLSWPNAHVQTLHSEEERALTVAMQVAVIISCLPTYRSLWSSKPPTTAGTSNRNDASSQRHLVNVQTSIELGVSGKRSQSSIDGSTWEDERGVHRTGVQTDISGGKL